MDNDLAASTRDEATLNDFIDELLVNSEPIDDFIADQVLQGEAAGEMVVDTPGWLQGEAAVETALPCTSAVPETGSCATPTCAPFACWGAELLGEAAQCISGFKGGRAHFKNKCAAARLTEPSGSASTSGA